LRPLGRTGEQSPFPPYRTRRRAGGRNRTRGSDRILILRLCLSPHFFPEFSRAPSSAGCHRADSARLADSFSLRPGTGIGADDRALAGICEACAKGTHRLWKGWSSRNAPVL
jgi:hypothetical protein